MKILYQDPDLIVCIKPSGVVSTDEPGGMPGRIREAIGREAQVRTVHRLDAMVAGLMVYALSQPAASGLSEQITAGSFTKEYMAVLEGCPAQPEAKLHDYLLRSQKDRKTYTVDPAVKDAQEAALAYTLCARSAELSLVRVRLITGRTHQIRAQFSSRGLPLYGDGKYGSKNGTARIALWSCHLRFTHPINGKPMDFSALPPAAEPWTGFPSFSEEYDEADVAVAFQRSSTFSDCPYAYACEGCAYQGMDEPRQREKKQKLAAKWLRPYGVPAPILAAEEPLHYKTKVLITFSKDKNGQVISGSYSRKDRRMLRIDRCALNHPTAEAIKASLLQLANRYQVPVYEEKKGSGWLKSALLRVSAANGDVMLTLIVTSADCAAGRAMLQDLLPMHPQIRTLLLNFSPTGSSAAFGKEQQVLYGSGSLEEELCGLHYRIYPRTAFPSNPRQAEKFCRAAVDLASLTGCERVLDLGCGIGTRGLTAASMAERVLCVDASREALREAEANARLNQLTNVRAICSDPEDYVRALVRSRDRIDAVFLDSSRSRLSPAALKAVAALGPGKLICCSSDAEKLARDLELFTASGYRVKQILLADPAPFAPAVDAAALLERTFSKH